MEKIFNMKSSIQVFLLAVFLQTVIQECEANTCPSRGTFDNGEIYYDRSAINGKYPVSTIAFYSCNVGYKQPTSQSRSAICLDSGSWAFPGQPKQCIADTEICPEPSLPGATLGFSNLFPDNPQQRYGITAHFWCENNFIRYGSGRALCNNNGHWESSDGNTHSPVCIATCAALSLENGHVNYNRDTGSNSRYLYGTVASFTCNPGYSRSGSSSTFCTFLRSWAPVTVTCNIVPTPTPPPPTTTQLPPPPPPPPSDSGCFPSSANVLLKNGKSVTMSELQTGDHVQTVSSRGTIIYSEVKSFLKKQPNIMTQYKLITTVNETLTVTGNHLIYVRKNLADQFNPEFANQLLIGNEILVQKNHILTPQKVINLSDIDSPGAYVPLIKEGKIMVDGVLASCYADIHHDVAHLIMMPMQRFPAVMEWIFGEDTGFPVYVSTARQLGMMLLPNDSSSSFSS